MAAKVSYVGFSRVVCVLQADKQDDSDGDDPIIAFLEAEMRKDPAWLLPTDFQDLVSRFAQLADVPPELVGTECKSAPQAFHTLHLCPTHIWHSALMCCMNAIGSFCLLLSCIPSSRLLWMLSIFCTEMCMD
jgi:hypothetical protein